MPTPEELARQQIDALLQQCGWVVQTKKQINLTAAPGVAICEIFDASPLDLAEGEYPGSHCDNCAQPGRSCNETAPHGLARRFKISRLEQG